MHPDPVRLLALNFGAARKAVTKGFEHAQLSVRYLLERRLRAIAMDELVAISLQE